MKMLTTPRAMLRFCAAVLLFATTAAADLPEDVEEVLERNIEAMGGREKIADIKSTRLKGTFSIAAMGMTGTTVLVHMYPDKVYSKQVMPGMGEIIQACDGDTGWSQDPLQGFRVLSPPELAMLKQNESLREVLDFDSAYSSGSLVGEAEVKEESTTVIKLVNAETGQEETHYYSKKDGLLKKMETIADMGAMGKLPATMLITGYTEKDGIVYPTGLEVENAGMTIELSFTSLELSPEIDPALFQAPQ